jgi:hypothetical protein
MFINENKNGVLYMILADKGYNRQNAFNVLEKIKD